MRRVIPIIVIFLGHLLLVPALAEEDQKVDLYLETGHPVSSATFSLDGKTITSFGDGTLKLWDVASGQEMDTLKPSQLVYSPDQKTIVLATTNEKTITLWDVASWRKRKTLISDGSLGVFFFSPNGKTLVLSSSTSLMFWDLESGNQLLTLKLDAAANLTAFVSPDGKTIARVENDEITLLDTNTGQKLNTLSLAAGYRYLIYSPDGKMIASWNNTTLKLWEVASGRELHTITDLAGGFVTFSPDGKTIAVVGNNRLRLFDVSARQELNGLGGSITSIVFSPDGKTIALSFGIWNDVGIALWDTGSTSKIRILREHGAAYFPVFSPDGKTIAIGATNFLDGFYSSALSLDALWDVASGQELPLLKKGSRLLVLPGGKGAASWAQGGDTIKLLDPVSWREIGTLKSDFSIGTVNFYPDQKIILSRNDKAVTLWDAASGRKLNTLEGAIGLAAAFVFSPDAKKIAAVTDKIAVWDLTSGRQLHDLKGNAFAVKFFALSPDATLLATWVSQDNVIKIWDLASTQGPRTLLLNEKLSSQHHAGPNPLLPMISPMAAEFSPDGKTLAVWSTTEGLAGLWDVASGKKLLSLEVKAGSLARVVFSPDGKTIVAGKGNGIALWDVATGAQGRTFKAYEGGDIIFSPDGKLLASWNADYTIKVWNLASGWELHSSEGHSQPVFAIAFSPDSKRIASASADQTVMLWDAASGQRLKTFTGQGNPVGSVAFAADGKTIASGSFDTIRLWDVSSGQILKTFQPNDPKTPGEVHQIVPDYFRQNKAAPISSDGNFQVKLGENGRVNLSDVKTGLPLLSFIALANEEWAVTTPAGRFDTNKSLDRIAGLHWVVNGEFLKPLPLDIFMRQYYEPGLLRRALRREAFNPLPSIADINRVQPQVAIRDIKPAANGIDLVDVTVEVESATEEVSISATDPAKKKRFSSGVFDLRMFRNGQLIGYSTSDKKLQTTFRPYKNFDDELAVWREANRVDLVKGKKTFSFTVKLPANSQSKEVEFSAYAFNEDRVKSNTAVARWALDGVAKSQPARSRVKPRAFVISVGVNANENPAFDLQFAANDATRFQEMLSSRLAATEEYSEVVSVALISDWENRGGKKVTTRREATKANIKAVLDLLAGRQVSDEIKRALRNADKLRRTTPEDLVLILISSHGYTDRNGSFYFIPHDTGPGACKVFTESVRQRSISSDELSLWLRDVDAGQMTLIVDACYSTAAIESSGFKPGPMGSRGLGQLAYDKRMRILTATQADNVAMEMPLTADGRPVRHGLLSYALLENGLEENEADFKPQDQTIFMDEWLEFGASKVPKLFAVMPKSSESLGPGKIRTAPASTHDQPRLVLLPRELSDTGACGPVANAVTVTRAQEQQPGLFDFTRRKREVALVRNQ